MKHTTMEIQVPKIGIGVIGYAFMGRVHSNAYIKMRYSFPQVSLFPELIAVSGRNEDNVSAFASKYGYNNYYTDWNELIADPNVKIVDNCSADPNHFGPALETLNRGKHLIIEKPLGLNVEECKKIVMASKTSDSKNMVCFNYRFMPAVRLARNIIQTGRLGKIYNIRGCYYQSPGYDPDKPSDNVWYCRPERVGIMQGIGSHIIDLSRFLVGEISSVSCLTRTFNKERNTASGERIKVEKDELNISIVEFETGAVGTIESSGISAGHRNRNEFEIFGSRGSLRFSLEDLNWLDICIPGEQASDSQGYTRVSVTEPDHPNQIVYLPRGHIQGWEYGHLHALKHFLDCVARNEPVEPMGATLEDGLQVQRIMDGMFESSKTGRRIDL